MAFDFQKLGIDRLSQNVARSVNQPVGALVTGNITKGEVVSVTVGTSTVGATSATATVSGQRTGAILISTDCIAHRYAWSISDTTLTVTTSGSASGEAFEFWVF